MKSLKRKLVKIFPSKDEIPFQNRWGTWVWRTKNQNADPNWPGLKPPKGCTHPELKDGQWTWI